MRIPLSVLITCSLGFAACGGSTNGPNQIPTSGVPRMSIVSGDSQTVAVTDSLPNPIKVEVTRDGKPVKNQLVDWHVVEQNAGEPFVTTTKTNTDGTTQNRLTAGTWASTRAEIDGPAHLQVRWVDQNTGEAIVDRTIAFWIEPGKPVTDKADAIYGHPADSVFPLDPRYVQDQYGNPVPFTAKDSLVASVQDSSTLVYRTPGCSPLHLLLGDTAVAEQGGYQYVVYSSGTIRGGYYTDSQGNHYYQWFDPDSSHQVRVVLGTRPDPSTGGVGVASGCVIEGVFLPGDTAWFQ